MGGGIYNHYDSHSATLMAVDKKQEKGFTDHSLSPDIDNVNLVLRVMLTECLFGKKITSIYH